MELDPSLPWEKLADPHWHQGNEIYLSVAHDLYNYTPQPVTSEFTLFDGQVGIDFVKPTTTRISRKMTQEEFLAVNGVDQINELFQLTDLTVAMTLLDVWHPLLVISQENQVNWTTGLGSNCGPIKSSKNGSIEVASTAHLDVSAGDGMTHEVMHQRLHCLGIYFEEHQGLLFSNDNTQWYDSPIRKDTQRPMAAVLHAQYVFMAETDYYTRLINLADKTQVDRNGYRQRSFGNWYHTLSSYVKGTITGLDTVMTNIQPTANVGERFFQGFQQYGQEVIAQARATLTNYADVPGIQADQTLLLS